MQPFYYGFLSEHGWAVYDRPPPGSKRYINGTRVTEPPGCQEAFSTEVPFNAIPLSQLPVVGHVWCAGQWLVFYHGPCGQSLELEGWVVSGGEYEAFGYSPYRLIHESASDFSSRYLGRPELSIPIVVEGSRRFPVGICPDYLNLAAALFEKLPVDERKTTYVSALARERQTSSARSHFAFNDSGPSDVVQLILQATGQELDRWRRQFEEKIVRSRRGSVDQSENRGLAKISAELQNLRQSFAAVSQSPRKQNSGWPTLFVGYHLILLAALLAGVLFVDRKLQEERSAALSAAAETVSAATTPQALRQKLAQGAVEDQSQHVALPDLDERIDGRIDAQRAEVVGATIDELLQPARILQSLTSGNPAAIVIVDRAALNAELRRMKRKFKAELRAAVTESMNMDSRNDDLKPVDDSGGQDDDLRTETGADETAPRD